MKTIALAAALAAFAGLGVGQEIAMKEHAGLRFACGGVGFEERAALAALRPQTNLELLFATGKRGAYVADVQVAIFAADKTPPVLELRANGPMCIISAPAAKYRVEATYAGVKRSAQVDAGAKQTQLVFSFPQEP
jgi:hypothetical protein